MEKQHPGLPCANNLGKHTVAIVGEWERVENLAVGKRSGNYIKRRGTIKYSR